MRKLKYLIILVVICILLIVAILFINREKHYDEIGIEVPPIEYTLELNKAKITDNRNDFCEVEDIIDNFYSTYIYYNKFDGEVEKLYNLLDDNYVKEFEITNSNLKNRYGDFKKVKIDINNMYTVQTSEAVTTYFAFGYIYDDEKVIKLSIAVNMDTIHNTFSIMPSEYLEKNNYLDITDGTTTNLDNITSIEKKENNTYTYANISDEQYVKKLFMNFTTRATKNINLSYQNLDKEYREKRFENVESYRKFVNENREKYLSYDSTNNKAPGDFNSYEEYMIYEATLNPLTLKSYKKDNYDQYTQYVCIDENEKYYIFRETAPMQYSIMLDSYTIDLPEFTQKYEKATDEEKITLNLQKCFEAINNQDYDYVYKKLDPTFKANSFSSKEIFEKYMKANFYTSNKAKASNGKKQGNIYTYDVTVSDKTGENSKTFKKTFVMQLKEGTDFVMSFSI